MSSKVLMILVAALSMMSCSTALPIDEAGRWEEFVIEDAPPRRDLLLACEYAIVRAGYPQGKTDAQRGSVFSDWKVNLQPFRNQGRRYKGIFRVFEAGEQVMVRARVVVERNVETDDTLDSSAAEWEDLGDDIQHSRTLLQFLRSQLYLRDS
ncbi:MAG: hypothetical protein ACI84O_000339 [Myxococcota bacterium]|jgi:hypothetical protein